MKNNIKKISDSPLYTAKLLQIVERRFQINKSGEQREFSIDVVRRPPGVRLLITDGSKLLLGREFRSELESWDYRLVGGKIFESLDEYLVFLESDEDIVPKIESAIKNEGEEEAGITPTSFELLCKSTCGAIIEWDLYFYVVNKFDVIGLGNSTEINEIIEPVWVTFSQAIDMCISGEIQEDRSIGILLKYLLQQDVLVDASV